tara:strand:+ start:1303 stop:1557 length:255 start_codon:yes stop_codon:yes gene_type:complete
MITSQAYTNDKGNRLFTCTKVGRKWVTGVWWEYPVRLTKISVTLYQTFRDIDKQKAGSKMIKSMAVKSHGSRKNLPTALKKALY